MGVEAVIRLPVLERLQIKGYQLYPGLASAGGIDVAFDRGAWVIIGTNGLGKSTLLLLIRQALTGAAAVTNAGPAGNRSDIIPTDRRFFATRVADGARGATVTLSVKFGAQLLVISRRVDDLVLTSCELDGTPLPCEADLEAAYRQTIATLMGVSSFADVLRVLRYLVFVLEDRDGLIWSPQAQTEVFRALFVPERAAKWRELEAEIVSTDSGARNANSLLTSILKRQEKEYKKIEGAAEIRMQLASLAGEQDRDEALELELLKARDAAEDRRVDARTALRQREEESEGKRRGYERLKFNALRQAFGDLPNSEQYLFIKVLTERICSSCGQEADELAAEFERRRSEKLCAVCGKKKPVDDTIVSAEAFSEERASQAYAGWVAAEEQVANARETLSLAEAEFDQLAAQIIQLRTALDMRAREMRNLQRKLPVDERQGARDLDETMLLRERVVQFRSEREHAENALEELLRTARMAVEATKDKISEVFSHYADQFLHEKFRLVYSPDRRTVGQTGKSLEFPSFELELTSGATEGRSTRRNASQVSLSQREYLDYAFRMAVMSVIATDSGTFVIDGPEGSLDSVFARRAGQMLESYANAGGGEGNRLIVACNLVDTQLIPILLRGESGPPSERRVINLLGLATPSAALDALRPEYEEAYRRVIANAGPDGK